MTDEKKPTVTGISPAEGPPGTIVKIRGENLGYNEKDILAIFICNMDCSYTKEWKSSRLIHARTGMGFGMGDIIVYTKSGGMGTSLVKFRGYMPRVGLLTEAAVWVDESKLFEEKPSTTLSNRRVFSPHTTYTDPLGVAPEETGAVLPADKMEEWYPKTSSNPLSEEFNPSRFLLERHLDTSFDSLKSGYYHLQSKDTRTSVGPTSFVRGHLTTILEALHTLNEVNEMHAINESESAGGNICDELQGVLKSCDFVSNSLFKHILSRKDDADAKRNVLNVLHRYRFLFNLPRSIEKSIQQREYEILISDYNRAKALFQNTEVHSFKKALSEVDQKIAAFSTQLKQKLFDFPTPLEEQKKIIRYLNDLDYPGNAGWECITKQALWIKSRLLDCQVEHQMKEGCSSTLAFPPAFGVELTTESRPSLPATNKLTFLPTLASDMRERHPRFKSSRTNENAQQALNARKLSDANFSYSKTHQRTALPEALQKVYSNASTKTPPSILMVEALCELITENLSDLYNLGQTYLSKQLGDKKETTGKTTNERKEFQEKVKDVIVVFCEMVQTVLQPGEFGKLTTEKEKRMKLLVPWLPGAVQSVRSTLERLNKLGLAPDIISPLKLLTTTAIGDCIKKVLTTTLDEISNLSTREYWILDYSQAEYCISQLPGMFEKSFMESVRFAKDYMADAKIDSKNESLTVHKEVVSLLGKTIEAFLMTMEKTVYPDLNTSNETVDAEDSFPKDMQVLVLLSNCEHVKRNVMPRVIEQSMKNGFEDIQSLQEEIDQAIQKLDERVFRTYIEMKGEPLIGEIELGTNQAEFNWDADKPVEGARRYIQEIIMDFTVIHHQVSSVSTRFIKRIFAELCGMITDELLRIYECIDKFSSKGALQAHLELDALNLALGTYMTDQARSNIKAALKRVPELQQSDKEAMEKMMSSFKTTMRYQLATFSQPDGEVPSDPRESLSSRQRAQSIEMLSNRKISMETRNRSNTKGKPKGKKSTGYKIEVEKTSEAKPPTSSLAHASSEAKPNKDAIKKTKRRAPAPPPTLGGKQEVGSNPFEEDGEKNPFLDDDDENSNPFLDDDNEPGNPFLDDNDEDGGDTGNPFL